MAEGDTATTASKPAAPAPPPRASETGCVLLMRTSDGEEAIKPFRSLDELLSAAKHLLRTAARSPEPIWFSTSRSTSMPLATISDVAA